MISINDIELLHKYLTKYLIREYNYNESIAQDEAEEIIKAKKDILFSYQGLAWWLGKNSFEFFNVYFLHDLFIGEDKAPLSQTHFDIWQELEDMILKKDYTQRNYICPRGFGKTTCISTPLAIWCHAYKFKRYTVIASAIADTAEQFLSTIKNAIEDNERMEKAFGKLIDKKNFICNSEKIEFANKTMIQSISASGAIRGKNYNTVRIELLILDDYQKSDEVKTHEQREKKWKTFNEDAKNAMQKSNATMLGCGTIQHKECFYSRLWDSHTWKTRHEKGVLFNNLDEYFHSGLWEQFYKILTNKQDEHRLDTAKEFYFQNKEDMQFPLLWKEYWSCLDYALSYYEDRQAFMQEVQNDVSNIGEKRFKTIITESPEEIESHNFVKTLLVVDPAGTRTKTKNKDYFAFAVCSLADNNIKYIRKGEIHQFRKNQEYEDYINHTLFLLREHEDITHLGIEKNTYGGADAIRLQELINQDTELSRRNISILSFPQNKNKDDKINTVVPSVNLGQVVFNEEDKEAIQQLYDFCGCNFSLHDDFPDVVAEAVNRIDEINVTQYATAFDKSKLGL